MKQLPTNLKAYKKTDCFTEGTIPAGLLKDHRTTKGVWGKIIVLEGTIKYTIQSSPIEHIELNNKKFGVVEPLVLHSVFPVGMVMFYVEFYKE